MANFLNKLIREPLLHFVLLGAVIFIGYSLVATQTPSPENIVVTKGEINSILTGFVNMRQRQPTQQEFDGLIRERVRQEVYRREAVALGLDKDDIIIQRRLQQKMEFIVHDNIEETNPSDSVLQAFLSTHSDQFKEEPRFTFRQVFLDPEKRGNSIKKDAIQLLNQLNHDGTNFTKYGDPTLLPSEISNGRKTEISNQFGNEFVIQLPLESKGTWRGPFQSTFGLHLIQITNIVDGGVPALNEVREAVSREWNNARIREANENFYEELLKNYNVIIEDYIAK
ncbi:MAG: peptidylprolyl isomerase [Cyclobacteriaceae bacterium]